MVRRLLYLSSITLLIISVNTSLLGGCYHRSVLLRAAVNLLMLVLTYRFIFLERAGVASRREGGRAVILHRRVRF